MKPRFFRTQSELSSWLERNHDRAQELWVGYYKKSRTTYEQREALFTEQYEQQFRRNKKAWAFFQSRAPSYRKATIHWAMAAKRDETRARRLATLIRDSAKGETVPPLTPRRRRD